MFELASSKRDNQAPFDLLYAILGVDTTTNMAYSGRHGVRHYWTATKGALLLKKSSPSLKNLSSEGHA